MEGNIKNNFFFQPQLGFQDTNFVCCRCSFYFIFPQKVLYSLKFILSLLPTFLFFNHRHPFPSSSLQSLQLLPHFFISFIISSPFLPHLLTSSSTVSPS
uniref:Uncharacterized protein n=1 Tax=Meloidogyne enterolobii TaxID=390850 RepID=A0A6V7V078_MELEN|nr:unnamed protein product [Meloidogyne enterolobii]